MCDKISEMAKKWTCNLGASYLHTVPKNENQNMKTDVRTYMEGNADELAVQNGRGFHLACLTTYSIHCKILS